MNKKQREIIQKILDTPISPELIPGNGKIIQKTEEIIGPYILHDFFLYYFVRYGFRPRKILIFAMLAFEKSYSRKEILNWMEIFFKRFFQNQFKRAAMPDGIKVGTVSLSQRSDWRMPSDVSPELWLSEIRKLKKV